MKIKFICCILAAVFISILTGCSQSKNARIANELHFSLNGVFDVTISYDEENITFFETDGDELIIKEYMSENKSRYYARVIKSHDSIHISEGGKPFFRNGFSRYIEVYLPVSYSQTLKVTSTDGNIDLSNIKPQLSALRIDSTAGTVEIDSAAASDIHLSTTRGTLNLKNIAADTVRLDTTSGNISCGSLAGNIICASTSGNFTCDELTGYISYTSTRGNADIKSAAGSGSYKANNSGRLNITYTELNGNLSLFNKNGDINLTLPDDLEFEFYAATKNGTISASFDEYIDIDGRTAHGIIGGNPSVTVKAETKNGDIMAAQ